MGRLSVRGVDEEVVLVVGVLETRGGVSVEDVETVEAREPCC